MNQPTLFDVTDDDGGGAPDQAARDFAVDPANDVVLEASAGTGKTRVLVDRYVRLVEAGVDPRNILAITFTRKAAAEMRERVLVELRRRADQRISPEFGQMLRDRVADIQISTIDAFCYGLLREFPLEADVDPAFEIADETEIGRFAREAVELTLGAARARLADDEPVRLLFTRVKQPVLREAIGALIDRRHVAVPAVATFVKQRARVSTAAEAASAFTGRLAALFDAHPDRDALFEDGPRKASEFRWLRDDLLGLGELVHPDPARVQQLRRRLERYFLTQQGKPRQKLTRPFTADQFPSAEARRRHEAALAAVAPAVLTELERLDADVNVLLARGLLTVLAMAVDRYDRLLDDHALLDFAGMLERTVTLLGRQEEFARSRLKLQSRYHHVLVDEFQDTSRLQWRLVDLLIEAWGEGQGAADAPTSIFVVGDRKQSIYRFRHAEVTLLDEAARRIGALRPGRRVRHAITASFRAVPELQAFVNALCGTLGTSTTLDDAFRFTEADRFSTGLIGAGALRDGEPVLGLVAARSMDACAAGVANEVRRLLDGVVVRDGTGAPRRVRPDDIAILFRARAGHQYFEDALEAQGVRTYVYKGLGFFDAPEVQDLQALLRYLSAPESDLRAAELLRSRWFRLSDVALTALAPGIAAHVLGPIAPAVVERLGEIDRAVLEQARMSVARWLPLADRVPPTELVDRILHESAYAAELRGRRIVQARENVKKVRALVRRVENRGYATVARLAEYFETLRAGDESNAVVDASGAVNLMTIHAAKGLEFPVVFVVNLHAPGRGRAGGFRVIERGPDGEPAVAFHPNDATRLEDVRDEEELKRLLYVATTRARDRLYLSAEVDERQRLRRGSRSLASLLPAGLADQFVAASAPGADRVVWPTSDGSFTFRVCPTDRRSVAGGEVRADRDTPIVLPSIHTTGAGMRPVIDTPPPAIDADDAWAPAGRAGDRLTGTLVHRLFQRDLPDDLEADAIRALARGLLGDEETVDVGDPDELARAAAAVYQQLRSREDLVTLFGGGARFYEVAFSHRLPEEGGAVVRGVVDCLVVGPGDEVTVVEIKTGAPRPEHEVQAAAYARAISSALDLARISVKIVYPSADLVR